MADALTRRVELRKQRSVIEQRRLELIANRNFLKPSLDLVSRYRFRGFGDDLYRGNQRRPRFDNAFGELIGGDFQEWQIGMEMLMPVGFRLAHTAVRHSQLQLAREQSILRQQERSVVHNLSNAVGDLERAFVNVQVAYNRRLAATEYFQALETRFEAGVNVDSNVLLDSQRRLAESDIGYYQALVEHALAIKNVHYERGSLLEYNEIVLVDGAPVAADKSDGEASADGAAPESLPPTEARPPAAIPPAALPAPSATLPISPPQTP